MRTRDAVIEYQKALDNAGTLIKDLDIVDPVSALYLEFEATNGSTSNKGNFISDVITKIEVVDGSQVLYGVNLSVLEALHLYKTGKVPTLFPSEWPSGTQRHGCLLMFGRRLWDREYAQDFTRYRNPQLKITSNLNVIRDNTSNTGFVSGGLKATIVAKVMEDVTKPGKYLRAKEIDSFTSASSGDKRVELLYDYPYRMLLLRAYLSGSDIDEQITDFKLTCDTDKFIPFDRKVKQLDAEVLPWGYGMLKHDMFFGSGDSIRLLFNKEPFCMVYAQTPGTPRMFNLTAQWSSLLSEVEVYAHDGTLDSTDRKVTAIEMGHALHATLPVAFGELDKPDSWFDPKPFKKIEAVLTQAVGSAACQVVLEQDVPVGY